MKRNADHFADVSMWCRDAMFHVIRAANALNDQSQRLCSDVDVTDCEYHLTTAIGYLQQIRAVSRKDGQ